MVNRHDDGLSSKSSVEKSGVISKKSLGSDLKTRPGFASPRNQILQWVEQGCVPPLNTKDAFAATGLLPDRTRWLSFIDAVLLWSGAIATAVGIIFFFAYNWQALGTYAKFGLVEVLIAMTIAVYWRFGNERVEGKAALFAASLLVGALMALFGQTYQTGADTFELFATWAAAILPWVIVARWPALWLLFLFLVNLAAFLYSQAFPRWFGLLFWDLAQNLWLLFILNSLGLVVWEFAVARRISWLQPRWAPRIIGLASGCGITGLAFIRIIDERIFSKPAAMLCYILWLTAVYLYYRCRKHDLFFLAGWVLSLIVIATATLSRILLDTFHGDEGSLLFIGLSVIGMSALGAMWLKRIAREEGEC